MQEAKDQKRLIAKKLKELREAQNLTQAEVGRLIGKAFTTVASWESGKGQPDIDTLFTLLRIYQIDNVLEEFGYAEEAAPYTQRERAHIQTMRTLGQQAQKLVYSLAQGLADLPVQQWVPAVARNGQADGILLDAPDCTLADEGWQGEE